MGFEEVGTHEALKLIVTKPEKLRAYARDKDGRRRQVRRLGAYWKHALMEGEIETAGSALSIAFKGRVPEGTVAIDVCASGQKVVQSVTFLETTRDVEIEFCVFVSLTISLYAIKPWFRPGTVSQ